MDLDEKVRLRAPYVAPLNILQVMSLQQLRELEEPSSPRAEEYMPEDPEVGGGHLLLLAVDCRLLTGDWRL